MRRATANANRAGEADRREGESEKSKEGEEDGEEALLRPYRLALKSLFEVDDLLSPPAVPGRRSATRVRMALSDASGEFAVRMNSCSVIPHKCCVRNKDGWSSRLIEPIVL